MCSYMPFLWWGAFVFTPNQSFKKDLVLQVLLSKHILHQTTHEQCSSFWSLLRELVMKAGQFVLHIKQLTPEEKLILITSPLEP